MLKILLDRISKYYSVAAVSFIFGMAGFFLFLYFLAYAHLRFNKEFSIQLDPTNLLSVFANLILAMFVVRRLNRHDDSERVERDILIGYFHNFESRFSDEISEIMTLNGVEGSKVAGTFKKYTMSMDQILELARNHDLKNVDRLQDLEKSVSRIRELMSTVPTYDETEDDVHVSDNKIFYSSRHLAELSKSMGQFKKSIFNVIVGINRS